MRRNSHPRSAVQYLHWFPRILTLGVHLITMELNNLPRRSWHCVVVRHVKVSQSHLWCELVTFILLALLGLVKGPGPASLLQSKLASLQIERLYNL